MTRGKGRSDGKGRAVVRPRSGILGSSNTQGIYAVAEKIDGRPPFIEVDDEWTVSIPPTRLITWWPRGRIASMQKRIIVLELKDMAGAPLTRTVGPTTLHYWWLNLDVDPNDQQQARKWAKHIFDDLGKPSRSGTIADLSANNSVDHQRMKNDSPDLRSPTAFDGSGNPTAWETKLYHNLAGWQLILDSENTSAASIDAETAEKP